MNYRMIYKDELYHHGVKGMKWGVRRTPEQLGRRAGSAVNTTKSSNRDLSESARKLFTRDTDARKKQNEINAKRMAEIQNLKAPKNSFGPDGRLSKEGRAHMDKINAIHEKYDKQERAAWEQEKVELNSLKNEVFSHKDIKDAISQASETRRKIDLAYDKHLGQNSDSYKKARSEYIKNNRNLDDADYGFDHYEWRSGNKAYDQAYAAYKNETKSLQSSYDRQVTDIGKTMMKDYYARYKDITLYEIDSYLRS